MLNRCIYCNTLDDHLSDEHIVPVGLGGNRVIKNASCGLCRDATSKPELRVLRQSYGLRHLRAAYGIGRRRKKEKPTTMKLTISSNGARSNHELPLGRSPVHLALPLLAVPSQITNGPRPSGVGVRGAHLYVRSTKKGADNTIIETGKIHIRERHYDHDFAKMLAKIAWAAWCCAYPGSISKPWLPSVIAGKEPAVGQFVGNADYAVDGQPKAPCMHSIHLGHSPGVGGERIGLVRIHLFLQLNPSPTYLAAVGVIRSKALASITSSEWHLPSFGEIGEPMTPILPMWLCTRIYPGGQSLKESVVYKELKERGFVA